MGRAVLGQSGASMGQRLEEYLFDDWLRICMHLMPGREEHPEEYLRDEENGTTPPKNVIASDNNTIGKRTLRGHSIR